MIEQIFLNQTLGPLGITNFLRHALHWGVAQGYSLDLLILILLLPLALTAVAIFRYLIGLQGLGLFPPLIMAVAFLEIGLYPGLILFLIILLIEILMILLFRQLKIHFMAKMALVLLPVCLLVFLFLFLATRFNFQSLFNASIVAILVLLLTGENLAEIQLRKSFKRGLRAMLETFLLAILAFLVLNSSAFQRMMLLSPEALLFLILAIDLWVGHFTGLRFLEYRRFRKLLKK